MAGPVQSATAEIRSTYLITDDGVRLHVLEAGPRGAPAAAPVIAFVPGWSMPAAIWRAQLAALGSRHRVAALDPRGQGGSEVPAGGYEIERRAADIGAFVARYPRAVLVGWSLGALEALHYVHRAGDDALAALVLVDTSVGEEPAPPPGASFIEALKNDRRTALEGFMRGMFRTARPEAEIAALMQAAERMPLEASLSLFPSALPRAHWRQIVRNFRKPLLYVVTAQFAEQAENLRRNRPATRVEVFQQAGHALFVDEAERFNRVLARFVEEAAAAR
jgi:non-heme chloroperoxidase